jgi:hypothetical protein
VVNIKKQSLFSILILIGAILLIYDLASADDIVELKIGGLVILMIGLYGSTRQWVDDNKKEDPRSKEEVKNDSLDEEDDVQPQDKSSKS